MNKIIPKATHSGTLNINGVELPCYVLENGERVLSTRGIMKSMGRTWRGRKYSGTEYPVFLEAKNIKPFISSELQAVLSPLVFKTDKGMQSEGFKASLLPQVCETYLRAKDAGVLTQPQLIVAKNCDILIRAFAHVGIIALVDEATGYQDTRTKEALAEILDKFIAKEVRKWIKTFPDDFYFELFRLRGWQLNSESISKRPGVVGHITNDLVYKRLAPGVLTELRKLNPSDGRGHRKYRHPQWLTDDIGHPRLREHITGVIFLMKASPNWRKFTSLVERALPKWDETIRMELDDDQEC